MKFVTVRFKVQSFISVSVVPFPSIWAPRASLGGLKAAKAFVIGPERGTSVCLGPPARTILHTQDWQKRERHNVQSFKVLF